MNDNQQTGEIVNLKSALEQLKAAKIQLKAAEFISSDTDLGDLVAKIDTMIDKLKKKVGR